MVRSRSCRVIYYFDTPALRRRHQSFGRVNLFYHFFFLGDINMVPTIEEYDVLDFHMIFTYTYIQLYASLS